MPAIDLWSAPAPFFTLLEKKVSDISGYVSEFRCEHNVWA